MNEGRERARALREEASRTEAGFLADEARVDRLQLNYDAACAKFAEAASLDPDNVWLWIELGDLWVTRGSLAEAEKAFSAARDAAARSGNDRDLSVSYNRLGDVQVAQGDLAGALKSFRQPRDRDRLAQSDPGNAQRDLSVLRKSATCRSRRATSPALSNPTRQPCDPRLAGDPIQQRSATCSVAQGDLAGALTPTATASRSEPPGEIRSRQRRLAARSLGVVQEVGDVQVAQGDLAGALNSYRDSLAIADRLAQSDPGNAGWRRDLSVSYKKIGDVQVAQGDLAGALKSFRDSLAIADRLAQSDPGNAGWQRDLSVSYNKIGDVQVAQGDLAGALKSYRDSLAIADRLAQSDPGNAGWQRDLSVSYDKIGDVQVAQGDLAGALKSFSDSLAIRDRLAQSDPGNAGWRRDLAVSYAKIGDALGRMGDGARALEALRRGQAIMVGLTALSPDNAQWKRDLDWFEEQIAELSQ